ncbi:MAG TPA: methyl-accepting chemotaxis protein [Synergistaceae bacterium]|nr:methyl-accepting chemotaxis protein [Synergistaceae bacterium]HPJ25546.1 methyl-accepting chemotaxis protein [Synergistaceae bacterium]
MFRSIVSKLGVLVALSMIVLTGAILFATLQGCRSMSSSVESVADTMLAQDIENKNVRDQESAEDYGKAMSHYLAWIAAAPLWNFNEESLSDYAAGMLEVPNVAYAVIYDDSGSAAAGEKVEGAKIRSFTADISHEGDVIGTVEIGVDTTYLEALARENEITKANLIASFNSQAASVSRSIVKNIVFIAIGIVVIILIVNVLGLFQVASPLRKMTALVRELGEGEGDLTVRTNIRTSDEVGRLGSSLNQFMEKLSRLIVDVMAIARNLGGDSQDLSDLARESMGAIDRVKSAVEQIVELSEVNAAAVEETNAGVEEMASTSVTVAQAADRGVKASARTFEFTNDVSSQMNNVIQEIGSVSNLSQENRKKMSSLAGAVDSITGFVGAITGIADQTNLLALNAAIEAARAGEAGRGFAVVAEEVRKLAEESNNAAQEIANLIETLTSYAKESIQATEEEEVTLQKVVEKAHHLQTTLQSSMDEIKAVDAVMNEVAQVAQDQSHANSEMANAIDSIARGTSDIVESIGGIRTSTTETQKAFEAVNSQARILLEGMEKMQEYLSQFKV